MKQQISDLVFCAEAKRLLDDLAETIRELSRLHEEQFQAVVSADPNMDRFEALLFEANGRKNQAKYAYFHHIEQHKCFCFVGRAESGT